MLSIKIIEIVLNYHFDYYFYNYYLIGNLYSYF